jgi:hypothetical protein
MEPAFRHRRDIARRYAIALRLPISVNGQRQNAFPRNTGSTR